MSRIIVFGAGGRAGRRVVAEAVSRGHQVTAVVRDASRHLDLGTAGVSVVRGDVTVSDEIAALAAGHDAAVNAAARLDVPSKQFFPAAARALVDGLVRAGVGRLVVVGVGTALKTAAGVAVHDAPDFPAEYRAFSVGHAAQIDVLRAAGPGLDWAVLVPPPTVLDDEAARTGRYRVGGTRVLPTDAGTAQAQFSYADLAVALVDEIENPKHHQELAAVGP